MLASWSSMLLLRVRPGAVGRSPTAARVRTAGSGSLSN
jgi:hypothetical protein